MPLKITVLLGSPRKNGNSEQLAAAFTKGAAAGGHVTRAVRTHGLKIGGCIDCRRCWTNGTHCFLHDDMSEIYLALDNADVIVFAVPLYFYSWPAQIKPVWDRLLPYYMPDSKVDLKGRNSALLATAGDTAPTCFDGLRKSFELASAFCGWNIVGEICATGLHEAGEISTKGDWLVQADALGKSL
ncbi:MAG: flavodoxin family protein [Synergistaceae bacterium]|jgi:multimeric flavodoxin WrbA|nr:flavodoxin family protein [Synergistaceae bacterium]